MHLLGRLRAVGGEITVRISAFRGGHAVADVGARASLQREARKDSSGVFVEVYAKDFLAAEQVRATSDETSRTPIALVVRINSFVFLLGSGAASAPDARVRGAVIIAIAQALHVDSEVFATTVRRVLIISVLAEVYEEPRGRVIS